MVTPRLTMKDYYTYAYLREDKSPYYIGKGTGKRKTQPHLRKNGKFVPIPSDPERILILKYFENDEDAHRHEEYMIDVFGREIDGGILINLCVGGMSRAFYKTDEERRLAINKRLKRRYHNSPERRQYHKEKQKEYRSDPIKKERERENERKRYEQNRDSILGKKYKWREQNKERLAEKRRQNYDPEKRRQQYLKKKFED